MWIRTIILSLTKERNGNILQKVKAYPFLVDTVKQRISILWVNQPSANFHDVVSLYGAWNGLVTRILFFLLCANRSKRINISSIVDKNIVCIVWIQTSSLIAVPLWQDPQDIFLMWKSWEDRKAYQKKKKKERIIVL